MHRGLAESRSRARALILANDVLVNGQPVTKAGANVRDEDDVALRALPRFVSRGGEKLDHAIETFRIAVSGKVAADFGASTGGFTDCLLQHGAERVYAIDVGYGQLAERLRRDPRVIVMDRVNVRALAELPEPIDLVTIDVSFIGLRLVLPAAANVLGKKGEVIALVKPQFEAGREYLEKGGVVRDPAVHRRVLEETFRAAAGANLAVVGLTASPLRGPAGNVEFLAHMKPGAPPMDAHDAIERALAEVPER